jgi:hypothetical protein
MRVLSSIFNLNIICKLVLTGFYQNPLKIDRFSVQNSIFEN